MRNRAEELNETQCERITFKGDAKFSEMCQIHTSWELGAGRAALRRHPCNCEKCDEAIRLPWKSGVPPAEQPRFKTVVDCEFASILGKENGWWIVEDLKVWTL